MSSANPLLSRTAPWQVPLKVWVERVPVFPHSFEPIIPALCWSWDEGSREVEPAPLERVLMEFMDLADAAGDDGSNRFVLFVQRFGPLFLCKHGLMGTHTDHQKLELPPDLWAPEWPIEDFPLVHHLIWHDPKRRPTECGPSGCEPLWIWQDKISEVRALYDLIRELKGGRPGSEELWERASGVASSMPRHGSAGFTPTSPWRSAVEGDSDPVDIGRRWVAERIGELLKESDSYPEVAWPGQGDAALRYRTTNFLGEVARHLIAEIPDHRTPMATCSACGIVFYPKRKPQAGRKQWCDSKNCRRAAASGRQRARRARLEEGQSD